MFSLLQARSRYCCNKFAVLIFFYLIIKDGRQILFCIFCIFWFGYFIIYFYCYRSCFFLANPVYGKFQIEEVYAEIDSIARITRSACTGTKTKRLNGIFLWVKRTEISRHVSIFYFNPNSFCVA